MELASPWAFGFVGWWAGFMMGGFFAGFIRMRYRDKEIIKWRESAMAEMKRANKAEAHVADLESYAEDYRWN